VVPLPENHNMAWLLVHVFISLELFDSAKCFLLKGQILYGKIHSCTSIIPLNWSILQLISGRCQVLKRKQVYT
jgi:hypothetical protein